MNNVKQKINHGAEILKLSKSVSSFLKKKGLKLNTIDD